MQSEFLTFLCCSPLISNCIKRTMHRCKADAMIIINIVSIYRNIITTFLGACAFPDYCNDHARYSTGKRIVAQAFTKEAAIANSCYLKFWYNLSETLLALQLHVFRQLHLYIKPLKSTCT